MLDDDLYRLGQSDFSLLETLNHVLDRGVVVSGDVTISIADVALVYLGLNVILSSAETIDQTLRRGNGSAPAGTLSGPHAAPALTSLPAAEPRSPDLPASPARFDPVPALPAAAEPSAPQRIDIDTPAVEQGLVKLVLTLTELVRRLLEHQAIRRMDGGSLPPEQVERLGLALMRLEEKMGDLRRYFGLTQEDLNLDLGPLGRLI